MIVIDEENPWYKIARWVARKAAYPEFDAAAYYCPYIPLTMSGVVNPTTFQPNISFQTRYQDSLNSLVKVYSPNLAPNTSVMIPYKHG
jgi:hypothetical protein